MDDLAAFQPDGATTRTTRGRQGSPVDPYRLRRALLGGKRWLIGAGVVGVVVGYLWVKLMMSSAYQTTAVLQYEGDLQVAGMPESRNSLGAAADALRRQSVLLKIAEEAKFEGNPSALARTIGYEIDLMSGTLHISVFGDTAEHAAEFARIVTDVFTTYHKERQSRRIEDEIARGRKRIQAGEDEAEVARRRYNEFREKHGIANLSTEQQSMVVSTAKLRADSELMVSEIRGLEAVVGSLESQLASTPRTSFVSSGTSPERATYNRLREELVDAKATLSPDHPRVQALQQQVNQLRSQLGSGAGASASDDGLVGVNAAYQVLDGQLRDARSRLAALKERQRGLSDMADKAQQRVEDFSDIEGEASALLADVQVSESLVNGLRRTQAALEDALRDPPSGFVVLDPGPVPEYPVRNKGKLVVFVAIPTIAVSIVLVLVLLREFRGFCVETAAEVAFWGNGPVLSSTPWPNDAQGLDELVAGLDDVVPQANGDLLVIGASAAESELARDLASRLNHDWFLDEGTGATRGMRDIEPYEQPPLQTPPPSGPYPVGGKSAGTGSVALVRLPPAQPPERMRLARRTERLRLQAWDGPDEGQALRRAARLADRVLVLVRSGAISALRLYEIQNRLGRQYGIGYIVVGLPDELRSLPDRAGDVAGFWRT
jgi:uncharacterized protein involved in exopolysaccharide biosynthesis